MAIIDRVWSRGERALGTLPMPWSLFQRTTAAGVNVTPETAMQVSVVLACVRVLSEAAASVPLILYRRLSNDGKERATNVGLYKVLHDQPNQWQTSFEFAEMMMGHLLLRGNFYAERVPGELGATTELIPLHPDRMTVERLENGRLRYKYREPNGDTTIFTQDEIFHIRFMSADGLTGMSLISLARESIGLSIAEEAHGSSLFRNGAKPGVILSTDQQLDSNAAKQKLREWDERHAGPYNQHRTALLTHGLKVTELGMTNSDAQFIEARRFQAEEIARIFRVPMHLINDLQRATFSNIEHQSLEFIQYTMLPWFRRIEAAVNRDLVTDDDLFAEFLVEGLLRGDSAARAEYYSKLINIGVTTINEIRIRENLNPVGPMGDRHYVQGAMMPLDEDGIPIPPSAPEVTDEPEDTPDDEPEVDAANETEDVEDEDVTEIMQAMGARLIGAVEDECKRLHERVDESKADTESMRSLIAEKTEQMQAAFAESLKDIREQSEIIRRMVGDSARHTDALRLAQELLSDQKRRMIRWEMDAVRRAGKKENFLAEIEAFYDGHQRRFADSIDHAVRIVNVLSESKLDADQIAREHIEESKRLLLEMADHCTPATLQAAIEACVSNWESRA